MDFSWRRLFPLKNAALPAKSPPAAAFIVGSSEAIATTMESIKRIHHRSDPEDKVALFRSLFRGRDDVYPRRFESRKTGKSGYAPACANEWVQGVCEIGRAHV